MRKHNYGIYSNEPKAGVYICKTTGIKIEYKSLNDLAKKAKITRVTAAKNHRKKYYA